MKARRRGRARRASPFRVVIESLDTPGGEVRVVTHAPRGWSEQDIRQHTRDVLTVAAAGMVRGLDAFAWDVRLR